MTDTSFRGYAFIIGAMKCGTTTLHTLLEQHPAITVSAKKEPDFFHKPGAATAADYEAIFPKLDKKAHVWTLDGSTSYSKTKRWPSAPRRIAGLPGEKRIVYIMRDPVDRIESHIAHKVARDEWQEKYDVAMLRDTSCYASQIEAYEAAGLLPGMLLLDFDELCREPVAVAARVLDFFGLDPIKLKAVPPQNTRRTERRFMSEDEAATWREDLADDTRRLIEKYDFAPARGWSTNKTATA